MRVIECNSYVIEITGKEDGNARDEKHRVHAKYCSPQQAHTGIVLEIDDDYSGRTKEIGDGLFGKKGESFLGAHGGDCCSIALLGKNHYAIVHGSWKTLYQGIVFEALRLFEEKKELLGDLHIYFGPSIRKEVYEVGREFHNYFPKRFLQKFDGILTFDMVGFAMEQMKFMGVDEKNIIVDEYCTYQNNDMYFSHRKGEAGRNFVGISAKKQ